jgi:flagellar protein FlbD
MILLLGKFIYNIWLQRMIKLTTLDGRDVIINADEIEQIDIGHESVLSLKSGKKILVCESADDIVAKVIEYKRFCYVHLLDGPTINKE